MVWQEGMHLAQHHFQMQSRYFEDAITFALSHLFHRPYGLAGLDLDAEALWNGTVSLIHARGVMPDGLPFNFPDGDPAPSPRDVGELFSPTQDSQTLLLVLPPYRSGQANCAANGAAADRRFRYIADKKSFADEISGSGEHAVEVGRKNFHLLLESEQVGDAVALPLARIRRDGTGHFVYDAQYIPPLLQIGAGQSLMQLLQRLIDILDSKSDSIRSERAAKGGESAGQDLTSFWLLHTIHSSLAPLRHHLQVKRSRPEQLYVELARLAGALCTFSLDAHPRTLPAYDHDRLEDCFGALERQVRAHLEVVIPTNTVTVPLERTRPYLFTGAVSDKRCFGPSQWILGIRSPGTQADVITQAPKLVKLCSAQFIERVVKQARPALELEHLPTPPTAIAARVGTQYFRLAQTGPCWKAIQQQGEIGMYVPAALADAEFQLVVALEAARLGRS